MFSELDMWPVLFKENVTLFWSFKIKINLILKCKFYFLEKRADLYM